MQKNAPLPSDFSLLKATLEQETALLRQFLVILQNEYNALQQTGQPQLLKSNTLEKNQCIENLNTCLQQRQQLLNRLMPDQSQLSSVVDKHEKLKADFQQINQLAAKAQQQNQINGALIQKQLQQNQSAQQFIASLTGQTTLYDAKGHKHPSRSSLNKTIKAG